MSVKFTLLFLPLKFWLKTGSTNHCLSFHCCKDCGVVTLVYISSLKVVPKHKPVLSKLGNLFKIELVLVLKQPFGLVVLSLP